MKSPIPPALCALLLACSAAAQVPDTLRHSIPAPPVGAQGDAGLAWSVAVDGAYAVAGAPLDDLVASASGVVKVFDTASGALLHVIPNPSPAAGDEFGRSVAISGTRVMVGAPFDDTGANSAGSAYVYDLAGPTPTAPVATLHNPGPAPSDVFGWSVAISGTRVIVGAPYEDTGANAAGSAYVYDLAGQTPTAPVATLNNPSPAADDWFGSSVAISGARVVVGAYFDDTGATDAGSAYVYDLAGPTPTAPVATLNNPGPAVNDQFGYAVAISGTRAVVGTPLDDTGATDAGSAYVYDLAGPTPTAPVATLNNPGPAGNEQFGYAVAISGTRVVVGTYRDDAGAFDAGSAYVYNLTGPTPTAPVATLNNPGPAVSDFFGWSVAISGTRVVVGTPFDDTNRNGAGSAYVYDLASPTPTAPVATLNHPGPATGDEFGTSVAISGTRVVVGVPFDDTGADDAGSAYVYDLAGPTPTAPVATLHNPGPAAGDNFGFSVAISGTRVVVGAYQDDTGASGAGSAYVYDLASPTPTAPVATLNNPGPAAFDNFGWSVAISGTRVVVGAPFDNTGATDAGSAYVYDLAGPTPTAPVATLNNPGPAVDEQFGSSVAISGTRVVVGARFDDTGTTNAGSAYVYDLASPTPTAPVATLENPSPAVDDYFGDAVAISGTRAIVGARRNDTGANDAGSAYVYDLAGQTPTAPVATLDNPGPAASEGFGTSVAIAGTRVVVGAYRDSTGASVTGSAYVYDLAGPTPTTPVATLNNPDPDVADNFGDSVAIDGTTAVIGTPDDDSPQVDKGSAYVFSPADHDFDDDGLLDLWEYARFGTTAGHSALDDADGDGRNELLELAFDRDPLRPDAGASPVVVNEGGYLTLTLTKRAGVTYLGQSAATPASAAFSAATTTVLTDTPTTLKVRDNFPIGAGSGQRFLRVQVTAAP